MSDQKQPQPGQRNVQNEGDQNIIVPGDHNTVQVYNALPERSAKHQLRAPVGDFVGRETKIDELTAALASGGQASISGISGLGGIGKTELAMVVANRLLPNYPDAQLLVELRGTDPMPRRPEDALADCVRAFVGIEARLPDDRDTLVKLYRDGLSGKRVLVVLDNADDAEQVRPFLVPAGCALLVTSRETLHVPGMRAYIQLKQLPPDKARELFREMTLHRSPIDESVTDQICFLCGYLPLAVRAAASLLDVTPDLDPVEFATELRDERRRLELKYANAEGHEISVEASFNLSYARLSPETAHVFRSLAVFPASFDATAEEAICQDAGHKLLSDLARRNLVIFGEAERRYRLHDLARIFANVQLGGNEREPLKLKHAKHFCDVLAQAKAHYKAGGEQVVKGMALFDLERANIEAGHAWAASQMEASPSPATAELCVMYPSSGVYVLQLRQHPREQIRWLEIQLAAARLLKLRNYESYALGNLGNAFKSLGEARKALKFYKQALVIGREIGDQHGESNSLGNMGNAYKALGEAQAAIELYKQQLVIVRSINDQRSECGALNGLGEAFRQLGMARKAIPFFEQSLTVAREIGDWQNEGNALNSLGLTHSELGEPRKAIGFYQLSLAIARKIGDQHGVGNALGNLGLTYADLGDQQNAIKFHEQCLKLHREIGDRRAEGADIGNLGSVYNNLGERHKAIEFYQQHLIITHEISDQIGEGNALNGLGNAYAGLGELRRAIEYYEQYLAIANKISDRRGEGKARGNLGNAYLLLDKPQIALEYYEQSLVIAQELSDRRSEGNALCNKALAIDKLGERKKAIACAEAAVKIYEEIESPAAAKMHEQLAEWRQ